MNTVVLVVLHWGAKVEVFDVNAHVEVYFVCIRDGDVNVNFCVEYGDYWVARVSEIVKAFNAGVHADAMGLYFLQTDVADEVGISYFLVFGNIRFADGEDGTGSFYAFV